MVELLVGLILKISKQYRIKPYIGLTIIIGFIIGIFILAGRHLEEDTKRLLKKRQYKERLLGSKVVLDKDTVTIMDYYSGYYLLSNNIKVREEIIDKLIIK